MTFWAVPLFVVATFTLWILDRPGRANRWKLAYSRPRLRRARPCRRPGRLPHLGTRAPLRRTPAPDDPARPGPERTVVSERPRDMGVRDRVLGASRRPTSRPRFRPGSRHDRHESDLRRSPLPRRRRCRSVHRAPRVTRGVARWTWPLESHRRRCESPDRSGRRAPVEGSRRHPHSGSSTQERGSSGRCSANEAERGQRLTMFCTS